MSLECGIVGLPNVGKSTLFNTLTSAEVAAENFPFCTVDPNKGIVEVPDPRLDQLSEIVKPQKTVPTTVSFVDIAGLVKGASKGEGLGNQFLSHIRSVDAILHMVRCFEDSNITHVLGEVDPIRDVEIIELELCLADLEMAQKRVEKLSKLSKGGDKESLAKLELFKKAEQHLGDSKTLRSLDEVEFYRAEGFITAKPILYVANMAEDELKEASEKTTQSVEALRALAKTQGANVIALSASLENQIRQLDTLDEKREFYAEYGLEEPGLNRLIREAYDLLGLITFFTAGEKEVRAWTIDQGETAQQAAGTIHTDFARGFIRAEVIHFKDFLSCRGEKVAKEKGLQRSEGKEYVVLDGDVMHFRFNV